MYLIQQAELVVENKFRNNQLTKCTTSATTMKQEENGEISRKNGLNGNVSVTASTIPTSSRAQQSTPDQQDQIISHGTTITNHHHAITASPVGRNGDHHMASSASPHDLSTNNNNNALRLNHNNNNNTNNKNSSNIENGAKPNNNNGSRMKPATITGERLQFFKDGKFILELARAREGDKTGWVSVPRKTFWPPTVSSSTSANFKKHESSASLSCSDDNSSIQSSPWQRDHSWKKTVPRQNISKEMALFYHRPVKLIKFSKESLKVAKFKHRKPFDKNEAKFTFMKEGAEKKEKHVQSQNLVKNELKEVIKNGKNDDATVDETDGDTKMEVEVAQPEPKTNDDASNNMDLQVKVEKNDMPSNSENDTANSPNILRKCEKKLNAIVKKLTDRADSGLSRLNHIKSSHHQHVSPRKRILREFEKVSLEDTQTTQKRSRAKTGVFDGHPHSSKGSPTLLTGRPMSPKMTANPRAYPTFSQKMLNGSNSNQPQDTHTVTSSGTSSIPVLSMQQQQQQQHKATSSCSPLSTAAAAAPSTSQSRISSYSITSLLGHESSSTSFTRISNIKKEINSRVATFDTARSPVSPPSTDSRYSSACTPTNSNKKRSPSYGTPSPLNTIANNPQGLEYYSMMRSPDLSPSPEHQMHSSAFPRYRSPSTYSLMHASSSSPQSYSAGLTPTSSSIRSSPSPSNSDSYNPKYKSSYLSESPNHHPYAALSPSHRYSPISGYQNRKSPHVMTKSEMQSPTRISSASRQNATSPSLSPTIEESPMMKEVLPSPGVRNLPKKTAALRQQFQQSNTSSPPSGAMHSGSVRGHLMQQKEGKKEQEIDKERELMMKREAERRAYPPAVHPGIPGLDALGSALNALPMHGSHATSPLYPYMFPHGATPHNSYLNSSLSSYYQHVYAAAYRNPLWMHYPAALAGPPPPHISVSEHIGVSPHSSSWRISEQSLASSSSSHDGGRLVQDEQEDSNPDVPLNLSKH